MNWKNFIAEVAENIRNTREAKGLTQTDLAKKCKISQPNIARIEAGESLTLKTLFKVANAMGIEPSELLKHTGGASAKK